MAAEDTSLKTASVNSGNAEIPMAVRRSTGARRSVKMTIFLKLVDGGRFSPLGRSCGLSTPATTKVKLIRSPHYKYGVPNDDADAASLSSDTSRS